MKQNLTKTGTELPEITTVGSVTSTRSESVLDRLSAACRKQYQALKERLTTDLSFEFAVNPSAVRQVVNEASALAAVTQFPYLLLPTLAEEKVRAASQARTLPLALAA